MYDNFHGIIGGADGPTPIILMFEPLAWVIPVVIIAYLIGNISPSTLLAKAKGIDITKEGSGNAGTTNALRVMGKKAGVITLLIDILKGVIAVVMGGLIVGQGAAMLCVLAVFCGHVWPVFFKFKGGKGVATAFGALMGLNPLLGLSALGVVIVGVLISRRMSVGSLLGAISFPAMAWFLEPDFVYLGILMAALIVIKHRSNLVRLFKGEEPKLQFKKKGENQ